jgi:DNA-directed RNA polymerase subunit M/transcription elongation factor TFIIS
MSNAGLVPTYKARFTPIPFSAYSEPYNRNRRVQMLSIAAILHQYEQFCCMPLSTRQAIIVAVELAIYAAAHRRAKSADIICLWDSEEFVDIYCTAGYKITGNLDLQLVKNKELVEQFLSGTITAQQIAQSSSQELFPEMYTTILAKMEASKAVHQNIRTTSMYKCGKCKNSKCLVSNLYNRSLDEGVNLQVVCQVCQHRFTV